jgi:cytochrome c biogenesis protein CcmG, thiol:disulfide interchange protein DsbE
LVNFWATWCIPCRQEMPAIAQVYTEQRGQGFTVLEVNEQETPADVQAFLAQLGPTPPVVLDSAGSVMRQYRFKGLPDSVVVDPQGNVRSISYGPLTRAALLRDIDGARAAATR